MPLPNLGSLAVGGEPEGAYQQHYRAPRPTGPHFPTFDADRDTSNIFAQIVAQVAEGDAEDACATAARLIKQLSNATRTGLERVPRDPAADPSTPLEHNEALWSELVAAVFGQYGDSMEVINEFYRPRPQPDRPPSRVVFDTLCLEARRYSAVGFRLDLATTLPEHLRIGAFVLAMFRKQHFGTFERLFTFLQAGGSKLLEDYAFAEAVMDTLSVRSLMGRPVQLAIAMLKYFPAAFVNHPPVRRGLLKLGGLNWNDLVTDLNNPKTFFLHLTPLGEAARKDKEFMLGWIEKKGCAAFLLFAYPKTHPAEVQYKTWKILDDAVIKRAWDTIDANYRDRHPRGALNWYEWNQVGTYRLAKVLRSNKEPAMTDETFVRDLLLLCGAITSYPKFVPPEMARDGKFWMEVLNQFNRRSDVFYGTRENKEFTFPTYATMLTNELAVRATDGLTGTPNFWNNVFDMLPVEKKELIVKMNRQVARAVFNSRRFMRELTLQDMKWAERHGIGVQDTPVLREWMRTNLVAGLDIEQLGYLAIATHSNVVEPLLNYLYDVHPTSSRWRRHYVKAFLRGQPEEARKSVHIRVARREKHTLPDVAQSRANEWRPGEGGNRRALAVEDSDSNDADFQDEDLFGADDDLEYID